MLTSGAAKAAAGYELRTERCLLWRHLSTAPLLKPALYEPRCDSLDRAWCCVMCAVGLLRRLQAGSVAI